MKRVHRYSNSSFFCCISQLDDFHGQQPFYFGRVFPLNLLSRNIFLARTESRLVATLLSFSDMTHINTLLHTIFLLENIFQHLRLTRLLHRTNGKTTWCCKRNIFGKPFSKLRFFLNGFQVSRDVSRVKARLSLYACA